MRYVVKKPLWPYVLDVNSPQAQGLVGWWPGDPSGGGTLFDLSGRGNNGTLTNMSGSSTSGWGPNGYQGGRAINYDGTNDYVLVSNSAILKPSRNFSVAMWFLSKGTNSYSSCYAATEVSGTKGFLVGYQSTTRNFGIARPGLNILYESGSRSDNIWYHGCVTVDNNATANINVYVNGQNVASGTTTDALTQGASAPSIGATANSNNGYWNGIIDDTRLYNNRILSPAEVRSLYDPATRWSLRYQLGKTRYFIGSSANTLVTYESAANSGYTAATTSFSGSASWSQSNRFLAVDVSMLGPGVTVSSMTYGGAACTLIGVKSTVTSFGRVECWGIKQSDSGAPDVGSNTLAVTLSGSVAFSIEWTAYSGVHQTSPTEAFNSAQATNVGAADATVNITTVAVNDWVHGALVTDDGSVTANQTSRNNVTGALGSGADEDTGPVASPGATTISYTGVGALATWAIAGYAIRPTTASTLGNTGSFFLMF